MSFVQERLKICSTCPSSSVLGLGFTNCSECGCVIQTKALVPWARCPLNKWPEQIDRNELDDILINDAYIARMQPASAYKTAVTTKFVERFGAGADLDALYADLVERNTSARH